MPLRANHRHPMALQAETRARLKAQGLLDEHGNRKVDPKAPKVPAPPPPARPSMLTSGNTLERKMTLPPQPATLSAKEKLEALPDDELKAKATTLNLDETVGRDALIKSLLDAGAEG